MTTSRPTVSYALPPESERSSSYVQPPRESFSTEQDPPAANARGAHVAHRPALQERLEELMLRGGEEDQRRGRGAESHG